MSLKIIFAATPSIALPLLQHTIDNHHVLALLCNSDAKVGRKAVLTPPPTKVLAQEHNVPVFQPEKIDKDFSQIIEKLSPDLLVCFAYGKIFPQHFLDIFPLGGINVHPSLLPHWRGPSPIQASILHGEKHSGISVQKLAKQMDSGDILLQETMDIPEAATTASMSAYVANEAPRLVSQALDVLLNNPKVARPQDHHKATFCHLITKEMARLNYEKSAQDLACLARAMYDSPMSWTTWNAQGLQVCKAIAIDEHPLAKECQPVGTVLAHDKTLGILVKTAKGLLCIQELKLAGKNRVSHRDFINGNRAIIGSVLE